MSNKDAESGGITQALAAELRAERAARNLSYAELSNETGISERTLARQLNGRTDIDVPSLYLLATALNIEPTTVIARAKARVDSGEQPRFVTLHGGGVMDGERIQTGPDVERIYAVDEGQPDGNGHYPNMRRIVYTPSAEDPSQWYATYLGEDDRS